MAWMGIWQAAKTNPPELLFVSKRDRKGEENRKAGFLPFLLSWLLPSKEKKAQPTYGQEEENKRWGDGGGDGDRIMGHKCDLR